MSRFILIAMILALFVATAMAQDAGWIGITVGDQKDRGVLVRSLDPNGPAAKAGLKEGDVIVQFNKEDVAGVLQLTRLVRETPVGRTVELNVRRDNRDQTFHVTTEKMPGNRSIRVEIPDFGILREPIIRTIPRIDINPRIEVAPHIQITTSVSQSGIRVTQLTDQLRDFFGVYSNGGVLVTSIETGSAAEKAGLKAGDVIISVDGDNVRTPSEFGREMRAAGNQITLKIVREKQERELTFSVQ